MNSCLIVADDFTGANDTGVELVRRGIPVNVVFSGAAVSGNESCVFDTESRGLSEKEAFQKIKTGAEKIPFRNFRHVIKKVDSTLRGNIGAETKALSECYRPDLIIFAPAFPALGRVTISRIHCLDGTPVSKTGLASDPVTPVKIDDIYKIMADAFDETVSHIGLGALRSGSFNFQNGRIFCFDAELDSDLDAVVKAVSLSSARILWVGTAALAHSVMNTEKPLLPAFGLVASVSSVSRGQVRFAEKHDVSLVKVPVRDIIQKKALPEKFAEEAAALLKEGKDVILLPSSTYSDEEYRAAEESARLAGISGGEISALVQKTMAQIAVPVLEKAKVSGLFLSGGDTAIVCMEQTGALGSVITGEAALGMPIMRLKGGNHSGLKVVTKAGAFGKEDAVFYALRKLRESGV